MNGHLPIRLLLTFYMMISYMCLLSQGRGPIVVESAPNNDIPDLVLNRFVNTDDCIEVSNIRVIGSETSIGSFSNGSEAIGIEEGIVFSTGLLSDITGPNSSRGISGQINGPSNAPYLTTVAKSPAVFDAVGIEFDFNSPFNFVTFTYVFASEEYCEYVGSEFNDAFGFFVTGPGINGLDHNNSLNIARIPESDEVVSINTVNHLRNETFFVDNLTIIDAENCNIQSFPRSLQFIEYDGFTARLQAFVEVIPCETYRLRMVVGDVGDDVLDSGVFLESNSFTSTAPARVEAEVIGSSENIVYEDCLEGQFVVLRNKFSNFDNPVDVDYFIEGTAESGVDFEIFSGNTTIPAREREVVLPLNVIPDDLDEMAETVRIVIETRSCDCVKRDTALLIIEDSKTILDVVLGDPVVCAGQSFTLSPEIDNPVEPMSYIWEGGDTTASITDEIFDPETYRVTITDGCGASDTLEINASLQDVPEVMLEGVFGWCEGRDPDSLTIAFPGQAPWSLRYTVDNGRTIFINDIADNPFQFPLEELGVYEFTGFDDQYCSGIVKGDGIVVEEIPLEVELVAFPPSCRNANDGRIELNFEQGVSPFDIQWSVEGEDREVIQNLFKGEYSVSVTDASGCMITEQITVPRAPADAVCELDLEDHIYVPNAFSPNEDGVNDKFAPFPKYGLIRSVTFQIFDRWGNVVFVSDLIDAEGNSSTWDGGDNTPGVYVCLVEVMLSNGEIIHYSSDVALLR